MATTAKSFKLLTSCYFVFLPDDVCCPSQHCPCGLEDSLLDAGVFVSLYLVLHDASCSLEGGRGKEREREENRDTIS